MSCPPLPSATGQTWAAPGSIGRDLPGDSGADLPNVPAPGPRRSVPTENYPRHVSAGEQIATIGAGVPGCWGPHVEFMYSTSTSANWNRPDYINSAPNDVFVVLTTYMTQHTVKSDEVAMEANTGEMWLRGATGPLDTHLGMAPGTSPSITA